MHHEMNSFDSHHFFVQFSEYFKFYENGRWVHAPIIHIEKGNSFKVMNFFLEKFPGLKIESNVMYLSINR